MSDPKKLPDFAFDFGSLQGGCSRQTLTAEAMDANGAWQKVEINIQDEMNRIMLMMAPCSPTVH